MKNVFVVLAGLFTCIVFCGFSLYPRIEAEIINTYQQETDQLLNQAEATSQAAGQNSSDTAIQTYLDSQKESRLTRSTLYRGVLIALLFTMLVVVAIAVYKVVNRLLAPYVQRVNVERNAAVDQVQKIQQAQQTNYQPVYRQRFRNQRNRLDDTLPSRPRTPFRQI
jgi:hypothetical protein